MSSYLASLVENAHDAIYTRAVEDVILTWNVGAERLYGYTAAEMIGRSCLAVVPPDCYGELREKHAQLLRGEQVEPFETRRLRKDGQTIFVSVALTAITDPADQVVGIAWIARDITDRKRAEEARNDALEYAANIVETVREPMLVLDGRLRVRTASRSFYRAFHVTREETEGRLIYDLGNAQWDIPALRTLLEEILPQQTTFDDFEVTHEFPAIGRRVMLVNARRMYRAGNHTELILLAIEDITERRRLEDERRELETRFTSLVKNIRDHSIFSLDPQGRITSWNLEAEKILGYTEAEALGQHFSIIFTPEDREAGIPAQELTIAMSEGRAVDERWHARKGGERFWALGIVTPTTDARGVHTGYSKILRDMTDRKQAEEALRREHEFSESVVETAQTIVLVLDREGRIVRFNSHLAGLTGWRLEEVQGKDWFETFLPERDRQRIRELFDRGLAGERILGNVNPIVTKDGRERDIEWFDAPLTLAQGDRIGLLSTGQDITERKRAEEALRESEGRFRVLADSAPVLMWLMDPVGCVFVNRACLDFLGLLNQMDVHGYDWAQFVHPADREGYIAAYLAAAVRREPFAAEFRFRRRDGEYRWMRSIATPRVAQDGAFLGYTGCTFDVHDARAAENALRAAHQRLEAVVEAAPSLIVVTDRGGRVVHFNRACEEVTGYRRDDVLGDILLDRFVPAEWQSVVAARFAAPHAPELREPHENPWLTRAGDERLIEWRCITLPEPDETSPWFLVGFGIDVTERKRAEETLLARAAQQAAVAALGQKALAERDLPGLMKEAAQSVAAVLGVEYCKVLELLRGGRELLLRAGVGWREGLVGRATVGTGQDSQAGYTLQSAEPVIVDDLRTETRLRAPHLLNEHGVVSGMSCRIAGPAGQPFGVLGAHTSQRRHFTPEDVYFLEAIANLLGSVIQRRHFEEGLKQSEAKHRAVVDTAVDAIITIDEQGIVQTVNPAAERLFGYAAGKIIGHNVKVLMPSPYREEHDGYLSRYLATGERRIIGIGREVIGLRQDGTTFPIDLAVAEARFGEQRLFVGFIRDITERKQTEERFRLVVESAPNAIVMVNAAGSIVLVNSQAEKFFGYRREEMVGRPVEILVPDLLRGNHPSYRASFFASPSIRPMGAGRDLYGRRKDGSEFPVEIGLTPIQTKDGFLVLSAIVDISERKHAEVELRRNHDGLRKLVTELQVKNEEVRATTQQLWQAAKLASVGELAASIAHELNNPLATITLRLESLLEDAPENDPNRRPLQIVKNETKRMSNLVANLLQFSRRGQEQISTVDIRQELTSTIELVNHHFKKRQITIVQELAPDTPLIYADRQKLRQVFLNLFTNASDAMPQGGTLTLRSRAETLVGGKAAVRMEVADTGIGIPPDHLAKVFDPYFTTKEEGQGTGLGLAICRRIVEDHHGTIQIDSEAGKGSVVIIVLPVRDGTDTDRMRGGPAVTDGQGNTKE